MHPERSGARSARHYGHASEHATSSSSLQSELQEPCAARSSKRLCAQVVEVRHRVSLGPYANAASVRKRGVVMIEHLCAVPEDLEVVATNFESIVVQVLGVTVPRQLAS